MYHNYGFVNKWDSSLCILCWCNCFNYISDIRKRSRGTLLPPELSFPFLLFHEGVIHGALWHMKCSGEDFLIVSDVLSGSTWMQWGGVPLAQVYVERRSNSVWSVWEGWSETFFPAWAFFFIFFFQWLLLNSDEQIKRSHSKLKDNDSKIITGGVSSAVNIVQLMCHSWFSCNLILRLFNGGPLTSTPDTDMPSSLQWLIGLIYEVHYCSLLLIQ